MQTVQLQKDKLGLIEWITQLEDVTVIEKLMEIMVEEETQGFILSDEQIVSLEEGAAKYISGEERGYTWEEVKEQAMEIKKRLDEARV
jgi:hypothetical protein